MSTFGKGEIPSFKHTFSVVILAKALLLTLQTDSISCCKEAAAVTQTCAHTFALWVSSSYSCCSHPEKSRKAQAHVLGSSCYIASANFTQGGCVDGMFLPVHVCVCVCEKGGFVSNHGSVA
jgi:hypothetical protein